MDLNTRALCIQELLFNIFQYCDKSTAAAAARVCKAWESPALDVLWKDIPCVTILLRLFGWGMSPDGVSFGFEKWAVFSKYALRIRTLCVKTPGSSCQKVLQAISNSRPQLSLLPNLISLRWSAGPPEALLGYAFLFLSPSLKSVRLSSDVLSEGGSPFRIHILGRIPSQAPNLQSLTIEDSFQVGSDWEDTLYRVLSELQCLKKVALPIQWITDTIFEILGCLPELRHLLLKFKDEKRVPPPFLYASYSPGGALKFPRLRHLSLLNMELGYIARLLPVFQHNHITSVDISFPWLSVATPQLPVMLDKITLNWPLLESVSIDLDDLDVIDSDDVTFRVFRPLLGCTKMVNFRAVTAGEFCLTDDDMREFAMAWPGLRSFHLRDATTEDWGTTHLSPQALVHFARHCPNIEDIGLFMDVTMWRYDPANLSPKVVFTKLTSLHVGGSLFMPERWTEIVDFLVAICPRDITLLTELEEPFRNRLEELEIYVETDDTRMEFWKTAQLLHRALRRRDIEHQAHVSRLESEVVALRQQLAIDGSLNS